MIVKPAFHFILLFFLPLLFSTVFTVCCFLLLFLIAVLLLSTFFCHFSYGFEIHIFAHKLQVTRGSGTSYTPPPLPQSLRGPRSIGGSKSVTEPAPRGFGVRETPRGIGFGAQADSRLLAGMLSALCIIFIYKYIQRLRDFFYIFI